MFQEVGMVTQSGLWIVAHMSLVDSLILLTGPKAVRITTSARLYEIGI